MIALVIMLLFSAGCWYFVLSKRFREEHSKAVRSFYRSSRDQDMFEATEFAGALVGAIFFTIFFIAFLIMQIVERL
jgi:cbb3-type cytochrome oxidase subunit 3